MFFNVLRGGSVNAQDEAMAAKSYEEVLEDYEKFFSLDQDILQKDKGMSIGLGEVRGGSIISTVIVDFEQAFTGTTKTMEY